MVSIHAPCEGRDPLGRTESIGTDAFQSTRPVKGATRRVQQGLGTIEFQSTRPVKGATPAGVRRLHPIDVSIHAPCEGRDERGKLLAVREARFNPRAL